MLTPARMAIAVAAVLGLLTAVVVWAQRGEPVAVTPPPTPGTATSRFCARLADRLPDDLGPLDRRATDPDVDAVAAWGDPPVVLRCGVPPVQRPPDDPFELTLADVRWYPDEREGATLLTTLDLPVPVEVLVPAEHEAQLVARLAEPLRRARAG